LGKMSSLFQEKREGQLCGKSLKLASRSKQKKKSLTSSISEGKKGGGGEVLQPTVPHERGRQKELYKEVPKIFYGEQGEGRGKRPETRGGGLCDETVKLKTGMD